MFLLLFLSGCVFLSENNSDKSLDVDKLLESSSKNVWSPNNDSSVYLLVFSLPDMDRKMCETFPQLIISSLEDTKGVVDAYFEYEGHKVFVYYDSNVISKEDLLNHDSYSWIGVVFINNSKVDVDYFSLFDKRKDNNPTVMPEDHMLN